MTNNPDAQTFEFKNLSDNIIVIDNNSCEKIDNDCVKAIENSLMMAMDEINVGGFYANIRIYSFLSPFESLPIFSASVFVHFKNTDKYMVLGGSSSCLWELFMKIINFTLNNIAARSQKDQFLNECVNELNDNSYMQELEDWNDTHDPEPALPPLTEAGLKDIINNAKNYRTKDGQ